MLALDDLAKAIAEHRKRLGFTQQNPADRAGVSRLLIARLETGRLPEIGAKKLIRILNAAGLDLRITTLNQQRPTLDDLLAEEGDEQKT
jgi:transcriptional regulator with XRE-family HTH domain